MWPRGLYNMSRLLLGPRRILTSLHGKHDRHMRSCTAHAPCSMLVFS